MTLGSSLATRQLTVPISIPVHSYLRDHTIGGMTILPAVEMLQHMASAVLAHSPGADVLAMTDASFDHVLQLPQEASEIKASCELQFSSDDRIAVILKTAAKSKARGLTRIREHARATFYSRSGIIAASVPNSSIARNGSPFTVTACRLYSELVPFGPAFHSIQDTVVLRASGAEARVQAPSVIESSGPLGSSFPLDGALHAACVWGQRYCGAVGFPIGIARRMILKPIERGEVISCTAVPVSIKNNAMLFHISIHDDGGALREYAAGACMKDITGGRLTPPDWILEP